MLILFKTALFLIVLIAGYPGIAAAQNTLSGECVLTPKNCPKPGDICPKDSPHGDSVIYAGNYAGLDYFITPGDNGKQSWEDAMKYCENLEAHGKTDWFLPTINILEMLHAHLRYLPEFEMACYWSASHNYYAEYGWCLHFEGGSREIHHKSNTEYARCVRRD